MDIKAIGSQIRHNAEVQESAGFPLQSQSRDSKRAASLDARDGSSRTQHEELSGGEGVLSLVFAKQPLISTPYSPQHPDSVGLVEERMVR